MGKVTVFSLDTCPYCKAAKELLTSKGKPYTEISLTQEPKWKGLVYLLSHGRRSFPQIFFNDKHIGGSDDLQQLETDKKLDGMLQELNEQKTEIEFPGELRQPTGQEFLTLIPPSLREQWQTMVEKELNEALGGTPENPISSLLLMLETPSAMVVVSTAGPGKEIYTIGAAGNKGASDDKLYCQVAVERGETLLIEDIAQMPDELKNNEDLKEFGYGYYLGAVWQHQLRGTIVAMEKKPGVLRKEHIPVIEQFATRIQNDLSKH